MAPYPHIHRSDISRHDRSNHRLSSSACLRQAHPRSIMLFQYQTLARAFPIPVVSIPSSSPFRLSICCAPLAKLISSCCFPQCHKPLFSYHENYIRFGKRRYSEEREHQGALAVLTKEYREEYLSQRIVFLLFQFLNETQVLGASNTSRAYPRLPTYFADLAELQLRW